MDARRTLPGIVLALLFAAGSLTQVLARDPSHSHTPPRHHSEGSMPLPKQVALLLTSDPKGAMTYTEANVALGPTPRQVTVTVPKAGKIRYHHAGYHDCTRPYAVHDNGSGTVVVDGNGEPQPAFGTDVPIDQMPALACKLTKL